MTCAGSTVRAPGTSTPTDTRSPARTATVPALTTVASTLCAPLDSSREKVECASRRANARPWAAGWRERAKRWREALPASAGLVVGRVRATASRWGSIQTSAVPIPTPCSSFVPSGR
jgi:hypothetical protein